MNRLIRLGTTTALALASALAMAQGAPPSPEAQAKSAIDTRQAVFKLISNQFGPVSVLMRNRDAPIDLAVVARNAERIQVLGGMIPELFERDTREFKNLTTAALDGIWGAKADFNGKADALVKAAASLAAAAKGGDRAATVAAVGEVGRACGGCHDAFRAKPPGR
jgi:cytochrome c556